MRRGKSVLPVTWFMAGLVIGSAALVGVAAILPTEDPSRMYDQADLVCKGVAATAIQRADGRSPKVVEVNAEYSFKGDLPPGGRISVGISVGIWLALLISFIYAGISPYLLVTARAMLDCILILVIFKGDIRIR